MRVACPSCAKTLQIADQHAGKKVKCPACSQLLQLPGALPTSPIPHAAPEQSGPQRSGQEKIQVQCTCGANLKAPVSLIGKTVACPKCKAKLQVLAPPLSNSYSPSDFSQPDFSQPSYPQSTVLQPLPTATSQPPNDPFASAFSSLPPMDHAGTQPTTNNYWSSTPAATTPQSSSPTGSWGGGGLSAAEKQAEASIALENASAQRMEAEKEGGTLSSKLKLFFIILAIGGPILSWAGCRTKGKYDQLAAEGVTVKGIIMSGEMRSGRKGRRSYSLEVAFTTENGTPITESYSVGSALFNQHCQGNQIVNDEVQIRYARSNPDNSLIVGTESNPDLMIYGGLIGCVVGIAAFAAFYFFKIEF